MQVCGESGETGSASEVNPGRKRQERCGRAAVGGDGGDGCERVDGGWVGECGCVAMRVKCGCAGDVVRMRPVRVCGRPGGRPWML